VKEGAEKVPEKTWIMEGVETGLDQEKEVCERSKGYGNGECSSGTGKRSLTTHNVEPGRGDWGCEVHAGSLGGSKLQSERLLRTENRQTRGAGMQFRGVDWKKVELVGAGV